MLRDPRNIPKAFCWTKMGDEAGEPLDGILKRKELERKCGDGLFMWGIGSALGARVSSYINEVETPLVLFSKMRSKAKSEDRAPDSTFFWTAYVDSFGVEHSIPEHVFLTSRGSSPMGPKQRHYALVCYRDEEIHCEQWRPIAFEALRNFGSSGRKLGFSQVTAVVEQMRNPNSEMRQYDVMFSARLVYPYYVALAKPVMLKKSEVLEMEALKARSSLTVNEWQKWVMSVRSRSQSRATK